MIFLDIDSIHRSNTGAQVIREATNPFLLSKK